jgi:hypothetical protein
VWRDAVRRTHAKFTGQPGTLALLGDSITVSFAFWAPLQGEIRGASKELDRTVHRVQAHLKPECWRGWRGPAFGNEGGKTTAWAADHVGEWLQKLNPYEGDYSDAGLNRSGYNLRNALTAVKYAEVLEAIDGTGRLQTTREKGR